jgi:leucyl-tRNA synthetase
MYAKIHEHAGRDPGLASLAEWPSFDEAMLASERVEVLVQVLGKPRDRIMLAPDADEKAHEEAALASPKVQEAIAGKTVRKIVVAPGRLVNIVAN